METMKFELQFLASNTEIVRTAENSVFPETTVFRRFRPSGAVNNTLSGSSVEHIPTQPRGLWDELVDY
ncbi:hypothetical protein EG68_02278 [Paragonimus skrjabini miyazakii]|uniref:Uncharacterized protein n=1 Tax=Paragonimus skrjabini miyazakii TaxID=59628 RepID=A0A8S9Z3R5_9TREM|nr:hypothetical protein EG68_02278 [Paragonimus skrjabini miyazakii]